MTKPIRWIVSLTTLLFVLVMLAPAAGAQAKKPAAKATAPASTPAANLIDLN
jgi:hypothetical protein